MANRTCAKDGKKGPDVSCGVENKSRKERLKERKSEKEHTGGYIKTVEYTERKNPPNQTDIKTGHNTVETESTKTGYKTNYSGKTSEYKGSKTEEGKKGEQSYKGGNEGEGRTSKELHTRYYKQRSRLGEAITKKRYKQIGGKIESQTSESGKPGKIETLVYKKNPSKYRKGYEKDPKVLEENIKKVHDKQKEDEKGKLIPGKPSQTTYERTKVSGTDTDYKLGTSEGGSKDLGKYIPSGKRAYKSEVKEEYKKYGKRDRKKALGKMSAKYSKYGKG